MPLVTLNKGAVENSASESHYEQHIQIARKGGQTSNEQTYPIASCGVPFR